MSRPAPGRCPLGKGENYLKRTINFGIEMEKVENREKSIQKIIFL
jgi:hypothetical protein